MKVPACSLRRFSIGLAGILCAAACAFGQANLATITGVVSDSTDAVLPGVGVTVRNVDTAISRAVVTDPSGNYTITNLAPGNYELSAERPGFRAYLAQHIVLQV